MTKAERDQKIGEAIEWMQEDGFLPDVMGKKAAGTLAKFPGWMWDEKVARVLLEAAVLGHPQIQLIACLANMRANWIHLGPASARAWAVRWRNWIKNEWDPLVSGKAREDHRPQTTDHARLPGGQGPQTPAVQRSVVSGQLSHGPVAAGAVVKGELAKIKERLGG